MIQPDRGKRDKEGSHEGPDPITRHRGRVARAGRAQLRCRVCEYRQRERSASRRRPACVHGTALLERNKANVVAYYTLAFNEKKPEEAVALYGGDMYIQHNPLAANGFQAFIDFVNFFTGPQCPIRTSTSTSGASSRNATSS